MRPRRGSPPDDPSTADEPSTPDAKSTADAKGTRVKAGAAKKASGPKKASTPDAEGTPVKAGASKKASAPEKASGSKKAGSSGETAAPPKAGVPDGPGRARIGVRSVAVEAGIVLLLGLVLSTCSLGLLVLQSPGTLRFTTGDLVVAFAAGVAAAAVVRVNVRLHRTWKRTVGRYTAAAALCAVAALAGALIVMIPGRCPGNVLSTGHCGVREMAAWGQVAGLAAVVNFGIAGMSLGVYRSVRDVLIDASEQGVDGLRAIRRLRFQRGRLRLSGGRGAEAGGSRHPQQPKGRPTPRRADAERARRKRLRA